MTLHVAQLGPYPPPHGGVSRNMLAIRDRLRSAGGRASIIATTRSSVVEPETDVFHPISAIGLCRQLRQLNADVVHLHVGGNVTNRVMVLALTVAWLSRRSVLTMHSGAFPLSEQSAGAAPNTMRGRIFRMFDRIIAVNDAIADVFVRNGVDRSKLIVIPPFALESPNPRVRISNEQMDFFERHSPVLLAVGGLETDYDPLFQVNALQDILIDHPNAGLVIVGDGSIRGDVESAISETSYAGHILLTGNIPHDQTLNLIAMADILLRTTLFDGDAISVREALHLGTSVIATDNGMRPDGVRLIERSDAESLRSQINETLAAKTREAIPVADRSNIDAVIDLYRELTR